MSSHERHDNMAQEVDRTLLEKFEQQVWSHMPHDATTGIVNATPMVDLTAYTKECARRLYNITLPDNLSVWGKFDSDLPTGSIKARPAAYIIRNAIQTGMLKSDQTIIEATSGNFGIALGGFAKMGLNVISLVSRKLQEGVFEELRHEGVRTIDLDMDICPAPGMEGSANDLAAKATAINIRSQLAGMDFDPALFDRERDRIHSLLADQDIINLAKLLGRIYGMFCPEQYDNQLNIEAHRTITGPEMDQQLQEKGKSLGEYEIFCTFGTGGTSGGIHRYVLERYGKKSVHVIFPAAGQDVAGIRTKAKADGLGLYKPEDYAGQHEVDFEPARRLLKFFVDKGYDMGESSALALYAAMQMASSGKAQQFVIMVADGIGKYKKSLVAAEKPRTQVSLKEAASCADEYDQIIWVHAQYTPREAGVELIAKSLGVDKSKISITKASTVGRMLMAQKVPEDMRNNVRGKKGKSLLVCMAGKTSLMASQVLAKDGIVTQSLVGGITDLPEGRGRNPGEFIQMAID